MANVEQKVFDSTSIRAVIGLGNPGSKYTHTRHNIGFRVVDELAARLGLTWRSNELMEYAEGRLLLVKPQTYMNTSGKVIPFLKKKGIKPEHIVVVHDELEKAFGKITTNFGSGARGHNGLRSIIGQIGKDFWRIRFGIGRPEEKAEVGNYVLARFSPEEEERMFGLIRQAADLIAEEKEFTFE